MEKVNLKSLFQEYYAC